MRLQTEVEPSSNPKRCSARLNTLRPYLTKGAIGAELGVFKGNFIDHLLSTQPLRLYAVDPWYRATTEWPWAKGEKSTLRALMRILEAFSEEISCGRLEPRIEYSQDFLAALPDESLDWVYIDTTHKYEQTLRELELACKKVKSSGFIMGDDYSSDPNGNHYGVYQAVREFVSSGRLSLLVDGENSQFVSTKVAAP